MEICYKPIGIVHTEYEDEEIKKAFKGVKGTIEIYPEYEQGLEGIEEYSHIIAIFHLHKTTEEQRKVLKVRFRKFARYGYDINKLPEVGVFTTDSPHRPNPIAISILKLEKRKGRYLEVDGLDVFDGTPVLDIKAYTPERSVKIEKLPKWFQIITEWCEEIKRRENR